MFCWVCRLAVCGRSIYLAQRHRVRSAQSAFIYFLYSIMHADGGPFHRCLTHWNGSWVYHAEQPPPYVEQASAASRTNPQSVNIRHSPMCKRQQSWKWKWESHDTRCPFHHPTTRELCERLRGRRIILYGDSLTQQFFVSLASLTGGGATQAPHPPGCEHARHLECLQL